MLRNNASWPEIGLPGRILAGLLPLPGLRLAFGRPEGRFLCFPSSSRIYGPEALLRNIEHSELRNSMGSRSVVLAKLFFGGMGHRGQTTTHFQETTWPKNHFWIHLSNRASGPESPVWGSERLLLPQNTLEKVGGEAPHLFQWALR